MKRRIAITGIGAVTPIGHNVEESWKGFITGTSGVGKVSLFDASAFSTKIAAEVKNFDFSVSKEYVKEQDFISRACHFIIAAAKEAMDMAKIDIKNADPFKIGIALGTGEEYLSISQFEEVFGEKNIYNSMITGGYYFNNSHFLGNIWPLQMSANVPSSILSIIYNARGPSYSSVTACSSSNHAIGLAMRAIESGDADIMITGGGDSLISEFSFAGFGLLGALSKNNIEPEKASRPFDLKRDGFVLGEGAGILVLEDLSHALKRKADILAELTGFGSSQNAYRITDSPPDGSGLDISMKRALNDAKRNPEDIDYVNAHGTATLINDRSETAAIKKIFGKKAYDLLISSNKSMIGHLIAGSAGVELVMSVKTINENIVLPTINLENPDPFCDLNYVPKVPVEKGINVVLSNSFAFGGQNSSLVIEGYKN
ncbi:MAG: beta-ketoacyl-[acyl-carrier-protein] synthase family protein [Thermodesulfobacteriota bacterium]|nr:beta-ketoacyl-[acyl-carrier-protein] synthase family protein [Thermodesulfobacteriota bacterium]